MKLMLCESKLGRWNYDLVVLLAMLVCLAYRHAEAQATFMSPKKGHDLYFTDGLLVEFEPEKKLAAMQYLEDSGFKVKSTGYQDSANQRIVVAPMWAWQRLVDKFKASGRFSKVGYAIKEGGNGAATAKVKNASALGIPGPELETRSRLKSFLEQALSNKSAVPKIELTHKDEYEYRVEVTGAKSQVFPSASYWETFNISIEITPSYLSSQANVHITADEIHRAVGSAKKPPQGVFEEVQNADNVAELFAERLKSKVEEHFNR